MRILWCVYLIVSLQFSFAQTVPTIKCAKTDAHTRILGTQISAVIPDSVFQKSPLDPKVLLNTQDQVAIAFEAKQVGFKEYNDFITLSIKKNVCQITNNLNCGDYKGELMKIGSQKDGIIMWFGYLSNDTATIDFKAMYKTELDKSYAEIIQKVFTSVLIDPSVIIDDYEDLPFVTNSKKYNYTKSGTFMPLSLTLTDSKEPASIITISYFEKSITEEAPQEVEAYMETIPGTNKTIKMKWNPKEDDEENTIEFKSTIEFKQSNIRIFGLGPKNSDFLNNIKEIVKSTELK